MYCPGCGSKYPPNMLPWSTVGAPGQLWVCSICRVNKALHNFCIACGADKSKTLGICIGCITGPLNTAILPFPFPAPPIGHMVISKGRPPAPPEKTILFESFSKGLEITIPPPPAAKKCERPGCSDPAMGDLTPMATRQRLCAGCGAEWVWAASPPHWPKGWVDENGKVKRAFTFEHFLATSKGAFLKKMSGGVTLRGQVCPWCNSEYKVRPLFQFNFVGCLC